jgi:ABC-type transport system involved in multi-copper enzyme maturation permease subunit
VIILPLIERELRVRSRRLAVYWMRFATALIGVLICVPTLFTSASPWGANQAVLGHFAFNGLIITAFFLTCCAGLLTADSISRERREGTLGLLFLTRVRVFDVLLGSFGSTGITCACALIACLPVLILPLLTGGVTGGEAFRKLLVLFDSLFLSLAAGLWASAREHGWFNSARSAVLLLGCLIVIPFVIGLLGGNFCGFSVGLLGPLGALHDAEDILYRTQSTGYWFSIAVVQVISWLLLLAAGIRLRRAVREEEYSTPIDPHCAPLPQRSYEPIADGEDPITWLVDRQRGILPVIWTAALLAIIYFIGWRFYLLRWLRAGLFGYSFHGLTVSIPFVQAALFGWAASRFFIEARRSGELELLLTTPLGRERIVSSQWKWLKHLFFWPVVILVFPTLTGAAVYLYDTRNYAVPFGLGATYLPYFGFSQVLYCLHIILGTGALISCSLWYGFKARSSASAIVRIVIVAALVPYLIGLIRSLFMPSGILSNSRNSVIGPGDVSMWVGILQQLAALTYFLWLMRWARRRLEAELAHEEPPPSVSQSIATFFRRFRQWPQTPAP